MVSPAESTARYINRSICVSRDSRSRPHAKTAWCDTEFAATPPFQFRCVPLNPPPDGDVIHAEIALGHQLFHVAQAEAKPEIATDTENDNVRFEMSALKQCRP